MRSRLLALLLFPAAAFPAGINWLEAPGGGSLVLDRRAGDRIRVASDYWRLEFDLGNGGRLDTIVFPHGTGRNLLTAPLETRVDAWTDANAPETRSRVEQSGNVLRISFTGQLAGSGRVPGPVAFETTWTLSPFVIRADHTLRFAGPAATREVAIGSLEARADLDEWGLRPGRTPEDPDPRKRVLTKFGRAGGAGATLIREHDAPLYLLLFHRDVEGFDLTTGTDLATWDSGLARAGRGLFEATVSRDSIRVRRQPLHSADPVIIPKGDYTFSYYLGLPRIVPNAERRWRHLSFGNHPWPSDAEIGRWAAAGVNLVRLHNDYASDENFWHDGSWPPYDGQGMAEMRRVIATCHRHAIKVVPYFSIQEMHPKAPGYAGNLAAWRRGLGAATEIHNFVGGGEFGVQMCPQSSWLERRKRDVEQAYRELGFDGIYYDWVRTLACDNPKHSPKLHTGADGLIDLLAWTRRLIGTNGVLILHLNGNTPSITLENFADLVVNMEELSNSTQIVKFSDLPVPTVLAESIPRSPCPSYLSDGALERNRNNIAQLVLAGMFPWSDGTGGEVYEETLKLFRAFQPWDLRAFRFHSGYSGVVRTSWPDVGGAVYTSPDRALIVLSNTSAEPRRNVVWRVDAGKLGITPGARVKVRDNGTGREVESGALSDGSLKTDLGGYEYKVVEVRR